MPNYLQRDGFTSRAVDHEEISGLLVSGTIAPGDADWCAPLGGLVGMTVAEQNRTSLALLLVRTDKAVYGLTFGLGHLMIDQARIDPGFGIEFAVRCLDEEHITKVRRQVMDARGRTDENSATSGEHIRGFGIEQFGEIVSQISGQIAGVPLTFTQDRNRPHTSPAPTARSSFTSARPPRVCCTICSRSSRCAPGPARCPSSSSSHRSGR